MNVTLTTYPKEGYLLIESKGVIETMEELLAHSQMIWEEIQHHSFEKILINEPEIILPQNLVLYFNLVKNYVANFPPGIYDVKIVVVFPKSIKRCFCPGKLCAKAGGLSILLLLLLKMPCTALPATMVNSKQIDFQHYP